MSKCKTVTLRKRKIKNGTQYSLCLDYYPGYRDNTTMKVITREALGIYIFTKPANQQERDFNARMMKKAEILRNRRYEAIFNENNGFFDKARMKGDFLAYFKELADRRNIKWQHVYKHFERFVNGKCTFEEVDVDLCRKFMEYLLNAPQSILKKSQKLLYIKKCPPVHLLDFYYIYHEIKWLTSTSATSIMSSLFAKTKSTEPG